MRSPASKEEEYPLLITWTAVWHLLANVADDMRIVSRRGLPLRHLMEGHSPGVLQRLTCTRLLPSGRGAAAAGPPQSREQGQPRRHVRPCTCGSSLKSADRAGPGGGGAERTGAHPHAASTCTGEDSSQGLHSRSLRLLLCEAGDSLKGRPGTQQALGERSLLFLKIKDREARGGCRGTELVSPSPDTHVFQAWPVTRGRSTRPGLPRTVHTCPWPRAPCSLQAPLGRCGPSRQPPPSQHI